MFSYEATAAYKSERCSGSVEIQNSYIEIHNDSSYVNFELSVLVAGYYYANFWINPSRLKNGTYTSFQVLLNDRIIGEIIPQKGDWQSLGLSDDSPIYLCRGENTISVGSALPEIPQIENISISEDLDGATIDGALYKSFRESVLSECFTDDSEDSSDCVDETVAMASDTLSSQDDPLYNFSYSQGHYYKYTFLRDYISIKEK